MAILPMGSVQLSFKWYHRVLKFVLRFWAADCGIEVDEFERILGVLAAVMCDTEDPCSVNTAHEPESSFTTSPRGTTLPLCVCGTVCPTRGV